MAAIIQAVVTDIGRETLAKSLIGPLGSFPESELSYFQVGEGGFVVTTGGKIPKAPDPARTDLEATGAAGDLIFQKSFAPSDVTFVISAKIRTESLVGLAEANDDGLGDPPEFFEIGLFDTNDNMIVYGTFPAETKTPDKTLNHIITIIF